MEHRKVRQGDEFYCPNCARRWGVGEAEPDCVSSFVQSASNTPPTKLRKRKGYITLEQLEYVRELLEQGVKDGKLTKLK